MDASLLLRSLWLGPRKTPGNQRLPNLSFDLYTKTAFMLMLHVTQLGNKSLSLKNAIIILRAACALTANFLISFFFLCLP